MNPFKTALLAAAIALTAAPVLANTDGLAVSGTLAFGPHGANGGQWWSQPSTFISGATEFSYQDNANHDTADFNGTRLTIADSVFYAANGWKMTFATASGFNVLSLRSSTFGDDFHYGLDNGVISVSWGGTERAPGETFTAVFDVEPTDNQVIVYSTLVPEPQAYVLLLAGLCAVIFMSRHRDR